LNPRIRFNICRAESDGRRFALICGIDHVLSAGVEEKSGGSVPRKVLFRSRIAATGSAHIF
jgi:hypothetical protein